VFLYDLLLSKVWKIEDFLGKWEKATAAAAAQAAGASHDPIALLLMNEVDAYRRCLPHLKTCMRGTGWEDNHWAAVFGLLGLRTMGGNAVSKETITLAHILDKADALIANVERIRAVDAQVGVVWCSAQLGVCCFIGCGVVWVCPRSLVSQPLRF